MSMQDDELIFGADGGRARDSDGDGVSDVQERLDGTDPNDAADSIRHDKPIVGGNGDPRGDLELATLDGEIIVDVAANLPAGQTIEQGLPAGLDGKPMPTGPKHYGNAAADQMLAGHADANSPLNMERDPLAGNTPATPNAGPGGKDGTFGVAGPAGDSKSFSGNNYSTPPAGADLSFRAPHTDQVSVDNRTPGIFDESKHKGPYVDPSEVPKQTLKDFDAEPPSWWEQKKAEWKQLFGGGSGDGMDNLGAAGNKKKEMVDPDAGGTNVGGVLPSDGSVERAIAVAGGATDFVEGYGGGPQIEGDAPPKRAIDLVTDGGADDPTAGTVGTDGTVAPRGQDISHPVNPQEDLLGGLSPAAGAGGNTGGGDGGDNTGRVGVSNAATAADAPTSQSGVSGNSDVINIGGGSSGGGINTLVGDDTVTGNDTVTGDVTVTVTVNDTVTGDVTGMDPGPATDDSGRASQSSAMMAGDDDDLEELEVQRADMAPAGSGTQTEDEIYIGATSAPVDATGGDVANADVPPMPVAMVAEVIVPILELDVDDSLPAPLDPVADAMVTDVAPYEAHATSFTTVDDEIDLSIPDEPDLDDGL